MILVAALGAGALLISLGSSAARPAPDFTAELDGGGSMTFEVAEGEEGKWALFTTDVNTWDCTHVTPSGEVGVLKREGSYTSDDGVWFLNGILDTAEAGEHTYSCSGDSAIRQGVADVEVVESAESAAFTAELIGSGVALAGVAAAAALAVVTAVRRRAHGRR